MEANNRQLGSHRSVAQTSRPLNPGTPELGAVVIDPRNTGNEQPAAIVPRGPDQVRGGVPTVAARHMHEGSFASGQETTEQHPECPAERGDFAAGEEHQKHTHQGSFAEGQQAADPHPEFPANRGDFAAGQRARVHVLAGTGGLPSFW
jgi:hypothetical protein